MWCGQRWEQHLEISHSSVTSRNYFCQRWYFNSVFKTENYNPSFLHSNSNPKMSKLPALFAIAALVTMSLIILPSSEARPIATFSAISLKPTNPVSFKNLPSKLIPNLSIIVNFILNISLTRLLLKRLLLITTDHVKDGTKKIAWLEEH